MWRAVVEQADRSPSRLLIIEDEGSILGFVVKRENIVGRTHDRNLLKKLKQGPLPSRPRGRAAAWTVANDGDSAGVALGLPQFQLGIDASLFEN